MRVLIFCLGFLFVGQSAFSQTPGSRRDSVLRVTLIIRTLPIPFLFEGGIDAEVTIGQENLKINALKKTSQDQYFLPAITNNNHLIKDQTLDYGEIAKVRRRSFLFIIPNRLRIVMKNGDGYLLLTWRRKKIIDAFKLYKASHS